MLATGMDSFANKSAELFDSCSICHEGTPSPRRPLRLVNIHDGVCKTYQISSIGIEQLLKNQEHLGAPKVQLIIIPIEKNGDKLPIDPLVFKRLITKHLKINPCVLWFIARGYDGFHCIDTATSTSYILATSMYMLVWRFDRQTSSTAGLFFERRIKGFYESLPDLLEYFSSHDRSPGLLAFVACQATCDHLDRNIHEHELHSIHHLESMTAFTPDRADIPLHRHKTEKIMAWLKMIADIHINLSNKLRITSMVSEVMMHFLDNPRCNSASTSDEDDINSVIRILVSRVKAYESYVVYLKERADRLSNVIFALLTHEDAATSTDMAKLSHDVAELAKRDSSAMKSITVITMAFLPGTFFATLFALPTLDWNGNTIVTGKFWVYWAFTLPTTALVFLLWLSLTHKAKVVAPVLNVFSKKTQ
ncbi:hypothetical protein GGR58DRAFT_43015 [Xylaria digitata]|nr:hypothetical protein GGR58DRAFT_43015 [Xylaria digitata]